MRKACTANKKNSISKVKIFKNLNNLNENINKKYFSLI